MLLSPKEACLGWSIKPYRQGHGLATTPWSDDRQAHETTIDTQYNWLAKHCPFATDVEAKRFTKAMTRCMP